MSIKLPSQEISLEALILQLETKPGLLFSYKQDDIDGITVLPPAKKLLLGDFFTQLLKDTDLTFEIVDQSYVLLSKPAVSITEEQTEPIVQLCGTIIDQESGEPLIAATIILTDHSLGVISDKNGFFQKKIKQRSITKSLAIVVSYLGYTEQQLLVKDLINRPCPTISMVVESVGLGGCGFVLVQEYLTDGILKNPKDAHTELQPNKMGALPGQAEPDVLNAIQFLPGISSQDGSPSALCIQGSTPDQNLVLWEGIPIYHTAHYFGMLSAFNPYFIDKVSVYAGNFGADLGGRIAGVIKMESAANPYQPTNFGVGSNLIYSYFDGQHISKNKKFSATISARKSMTDLFQSPAFNNITKRVQQGILVQNVDLNRLPPGIRIDDNFSFFDTNIKLSYQLSENDQLTASALYAINDFEDRILDDKKMQAQSDTFLSINKGLNLNWEHRWDSNISSNLSVLHTNYHYNYGYSLLTMGEQMPDKVGEKSSSIQEQHIHLRNQVRTAKNNFIKFGYQLIDYEVAFSIAKNQINDASGNRNFSSNLHVFYTDLQTNSNNKLGINAGLRFSHYGQIKKNFIEPRIRFWYQPNSKLNLHLSAGKYYQFLSQLIQFKGDKASIETPVWALTGSEDIPVLNANQLQLGLEWRKNTWLIDGLFYLKKVNGLSSLASGFDEGLSNRYHIGEADIQGVNLLVKKRWRRFRSWFSYSYGKVDHHFNTFFDKKFSASIDQPHILKWANIWTFGKLECSIGWSYSSGRPYSNINDFRVIPAQPNTLGPREIVQAINNRFNSERLPAEHQLDASFIYHIENPKKHQTKGVIGISLYNIYHQRNIYNREIYIDNRPNINPFLAQNDSVDMGFTPNFLFRLEW